MHPLQIVGLVVEIIAVALVGILLDRFLGTTVAVVGLCVCVIFLCWLHWDQIKPHVERQHQPTTVTDQEPKQPQPDVQSKPRVQPRIQSKPPRPAAPSQGEQQCPANVAAAYKKGHKKLSDFEAGYLKQKSEYEDKKFHDLYDSNQVDPRIRQLNADGDTQIELRLRRNFFEQTYPRFYRQDAEDMRTMLSKNIPSLVPLVEDQTVNYETPFDEKDLSKIIKDLGRLMVLCLNGGPT
jgi:hypothetical protein